MGGMVCPVGLAAISFIDTMGFVMSYTSWDAALACERDHLVKLRHTPEARAKLDAFLKK